MSIDGGSESSSFFEENYDSLGRHSLDGEDFPSFPGSVDLESRRSSLSSSIDASSLSTLPHEAKQLQKKVQARASEVFNTAYAMKRAGKAFIAGRMPFISLLPLEVPECISKVSKCISKGPEYISALAVNAYVNSCWFSGPKGINVSHIEKSEKALRKLDEESEKRSALKEQMRDLRQITVKNINSALDLAIKLGNHSSVEQLLQLLIENMSKSKDPQEFSGYKDAFNNALITAMGRLKTSNNEKIVALFLQFPMLVDDWRALDQKAGTLPLDYGRRALVQETFSRAFLEEAGSSSKSPSPQLKAMLKFPELVTEDFLYKASPKVVKNSVKEVVVEAIKSGDSNLVEEITGHEGFSKIVDWGDVYDVVSPRPIVSNEDDEYISKLEDRRINNFLDPLNPNLGKNELLKKYEELFPIHSSHNVDWESLMQSAKDRDQANGQTFRQEAIKTLFSHYYMTAKPGGRIAFQRNFPDLIKECMEPYLKIIEGALQKQVTNRVIGFFEENELKEEVLEIDNNPNYQQAIQNHSEMVGWGMVIDKIEDLGKREKIKQLMKIHEKGSKPNSVDQAVLRAARLEVDIKTLEEPKDLKSINIADYLSSDETSQETFQETSQETWQKLFEVADKYSTDVIGNKVSEEFYERLLKVPETDPKIVSTILPLARRIDWQKLQRGFSDQLKFGNLVSTTMIAVLAAKEDGKLEDEVTARELLKFPKSLDVPIILEGLKGNKKGKSFFVNEGIKSILTSETLSSAEKENLIESFLGYDGVMEYINWNILIAVCPKGDLEDVLKIKFAEEFKYVLDNPVKDRSNKIRAYFSCLWAADYKIDWSKAFLVDMSSSTKGVLQESFNKHLKEEIKKGKNLDANKENYEYVDWDMAFKEAANLEPVGKSSRKITTISDGHLIENVGEGFNTYLDQLLQYSVENLVISPKEKLPAGGSVEGGASKVLAKASDVASSKDVSTSSFKASTGITLRGSVDKLVKLVTTHSKHVNWNKLNAAFKSLPNSLQKEALRAALQEAFKSGLVEFLAKAKTPEEVDEYISFTSEFIDWKVAIDTVSTRVSKIKDDLISPIQKQFNSWLQEYVISLSQDKNPLNAECLKKVLSEKPLLSCVDFRGLNNCFKELPNSEKKEDLRTTLQEAFKPDFVEFFAEAKTLEEVNLYILSRSEFIDWDQAIRGVCVLPPSKSKSVTTGALKNQFISWLKEYIKSLDGVEGVVSTKYLSKVIDLPGGYLFKGKEKIVDDEIKNTQVKEVIANRKFHWSPPGLELPSFKSGPIRGKSFLDNI